MLKNLWKKYLEMKKILQMTQFMIYKKVNSEQNKIKKKKQLKERKNQLKNKFMILD